jgi:Cu+-exporting ATPase
VVDKTGTLTEGKPKVIAVVPAQGFEEAEVLRLAGGLERGSEHPLARAIVEAAAERGERLSEATDFDAPAGKGVIGTVAGRKVVLGNARFLREAGISVGELEPKAEGLRPLIQQSSWGHNPRL